MSNLIIAIHSFCSQEIDEENHVASLTSLCKDMQRYFGTLTFEEVEICFNIGYKGEDGGYGKYFGLCNKSYFFWLTQYTFSENRTKAVKAISESKNFLINPPPPKPTEEQIFEINKNGAIQAFEHVKQGKEFIDMNNVVYDFLDGLKMIDFTKEEKKEMLEKVRRELISEQNKQLMTPDMIHAKSIKALIETYQKGELIPNQTNEDGSPKYKHSTVVVNNTKRYALNEYFKRLIAKGIDFESLICKSIAVNKHC